MSTVMQQPAVTDSTDFVSPKKKRQKTTTYDLTELLLRLSTGGLITGHGAQKLFGWFGGPGFKQTAETMKMLGLEEQPWGTLAGVSEFGGGVLTTLGLFHPLGPIATLGSPAVATYKVHGGKPIWTTKGGAELPILYIMVAIALSFNDSGRFSLDRLFGIRVPRFLSLLAALVVLASIVFVSRKEPVPVTPQEQ